MEILWQLIVGLIIGVIARLLLPGEEPLGHGWLGWVLTAILGILGALLGTFIGRMIFANNSYVAGWIMSIIGAIILLLLARLLFGKRTAV